MGAGDGNKVIFERTEIEIGTAATSTNGTVSISAEVGQYFMCCGYEASGGLVINGAISLVGIGTNNNAGARILQATATTVTVRTQAGSYKTVSIVPIT